jgi:hypothetical protein
MKKNKTNTIALKNGGIYDYNGKTVRLRQRVGVIVTLREPHGKIFLGRADLLKRVGTKRVQSFVAKCA